MTRLNWNVVGERVFETGVDRGVLYVEDVVVPWMGLISVTRSSEGKEVRPYYVDGIKYLNLSVLSEFTGKLKAYGCPEEFSLCDGTQEIVNGLFISDQEKTPFSLSYRTLIGNDVNSIEQGYKIHLIYNALAHASAITRSTINNSTEPIVFDWDLTTNPIDVSGHYPLASLFIDSTKVDPDILSTFEDILYGTAGTDPRIPLPDEVLALFEEV